MTRSVNQSDTHLIQVKLYHLLGETEVSHFTPLVYVINPLSVSVSDQYLHTEEVNGLRAQGFGSFYGWREVRALGLI